MEIAGAMEGKAEFRSKRVVEGSEGGWAEMTSNGIQILQESKDLPKERRHTITHGVEKMRGVPGECVREKMSMDLRHASPAVFEKGFVFIVGDSAVVYTQPGLDVERVIFISIFIEVHENVTDVLLPPWPDTCAPNTRRGGLETQT